MTLPFRWKDTAELPALANSYGLDCYDAQADELLRAGPRPSGPPTHRVEGNTTDAASSVGGWVQEDNVVRAMELISKHIGYPYDHLDEAALTGALDGTNDESADGWFQYPLQGVPPLMVHLARSPGDLVVIVRVEGDMDAVLAARIDTLLDML
ncbi:hypothetical protein ACFPIJ_34710 [Dactylosporangium cerinum]|uniref:Uncharacterized protein n=1 Tax=Dactylosporangium cerinum TaxID=1434730 RepID=A0ABV9W2S9_9ACTN